METDDHPQRTIALSAVAIAAVIVVFATGSLVTIHQAHVYWVTTGAQIFVNITLEL